MTYVAKLNEQRDLVDLHLHTTSSDGSKTPDELIQYAIEKKLKAISITDHDNIDKKDSKKNI